MGGRGSSFGGGNKMTVTYSGGGKQTFIQDKNGIANLVRSDGTKVSTGKTLEKIKEESVAQGNTVEYKGKTYSREKRTDVTSSTYKRAQNRAKRDLEKWLRKGLT